MSDLTIDLFIIGRILLGGYFIMNGIGHFKNSTHLAGYAQSKGVPMPKQAVLFTGLMMLLGGLGVVLGIYPQFSILLLVVFLLVTSLQMHQYWKVTDQGAKMGEQINFQKNMALLGALLMLLAIGTPWVASVMLQ